METLKNNKVLPVAVATLAIMLTAAVFSVSAQESGVETAQDSTRYEEMKEGRGESHEAVKAAVESGDYTAFVAAISELPKAEERLEKVTEESFAKMVEAHALMEAGDKEGAREIMKELGFEGKHNKEHRRKFVGQLDEDQMAELKALKASFKEADLSKEDMKAKVEALMSEFGVEMPKHPVLSKLDEAQKVELEAMKEAGASREEVKDYLETQGIEWDKKGQHKGFQKLDLTDEQKEVLKTIKGSEATKEEMKEQVGAYLDAQGIERPEKPVDRGERVELTEDQKAQLKEFKELGLSRAEMKEKMEVMGIERPEHRGGQRGGR